MASSQSQALQYLSASVRLYFQGHARDRHRRGQWGAARNGRVYVRESTLAVLATLYPPAARAARSTRRPHDPVAIALSGEAHAGGGAEEYEPAAFAQTRAHEGCPSRKRRWPSPPPWPASPPVCSTPFQRHPGNRHPAPWKTKPLDNRDYR